MFKIGTHTFDTEHHCYIMGILNVTPDSFSDGGKWNDLSRALSHTEEMIRDGASIIDIGGESTRPGHVPVSIEEEIERVVPCIEAVKARFDIPVSIDTYKSQVAEAALAAGADLVNDIWGLKHDPDMAGVIARYRAPCCLTHNRSEAVYTDFLPDYLKDIEEMLALADAAKIPREQILLDPGIGFGKTYEQNLTAIRRLDVLQAFGCPILLAASRKSVVGLTLDLPSDQRVEGTLATTVMGIERGASFIRVHDVRENYRAICMTQSILQERKISYETKV